MARMFEGSIPDMSGSMSKDTEKPWDLICISNQGDERFVVLQNFEAEGIPAYILESLPLTIGKRYLRRYDSFNVTVMNDLGEIVEYPRELFEKTTLQNWRDSQLDRLFG